MHAPNRRIYELDAIRGIGAIAVVLYHLFRRYDQIYGHSFSVSETFSYGRLGVELFFLLSGFVILISLERVKSWLDFPVSRFARLFPTYWFAVVLTFTAIALFGLPGRETTVRDALINFTMLQGYFKGVSDVDGVYWTLTKELSFYALMYCLLLTKQLKNIEYWCLGWLGVSLAYELRLDSLFQGHWSFVVFNQLLIADYAHLFIAGICFYKIYTRRSSDLTVAVLVGSLMMNGLLYEEFRLFWVASFYCLFLILTLVPVHFLQHKFLLSLGGLTYSLYLIHQNISYIIIRKGYEFGLPGLVSTFAAFAISMGLAYVATRFIEMPVNNAIRSKYKQWQLARQIPVQDTKPAPELVKR